MNLKHQAKGASLDLFSRLSFVFFYSRPLLIPVQLLEQLPLQSNKNHGYNLPSFPELFRSLIDFFRVKYKHLSPAGLNSNTGFDQSVYSAYEL